MKLINNILKVLSSTLCVLLLGFYYPGFIYSFSYRLWLFIKNKNSNVFYAATDHKFSSSIENGKKENWYRNYLVHAATVIVFLHSLFAYTYVDYHFYPVQDGQSRSFFVDIACGLFWLFGSSTLFIVSGRNLKDLIDSKNNSNVFKKTIIGFKNLIILMIINAFCFYSICQIWPEINLRFNGVPFWLRLNHLWFVTYLLICNALMACFICLSQFIPKIIKNNLKSTLSKHPDFILFCISFFFLVQSRFGIIIGVPASDFKINPFYLTNFFSLFLFGFLTAKTKNYNIPFSKLVKYLLASLVSSIAIFFFISIHHTVLSLIAVAGFASLFLTAQSNITVTMSLLFFKTKDKIFDFLYPTINLVFFFNYPIIIILHKLLERFSIPIILKILVVNLITWSFFLTLNYFLKLVLRKRSRKEQ